MKSPPETLSDISPLLEQLMEELEDAKDKTRQKKLRREIGELWIELPPYDCHFGHHHRLLNARGWVILPTYYVVAREGFEAEAELWLRDHGIKAPRGCRSNRRTLGRHMQRADIDLASPSDEVGRLFEINIKLNLHRRKTRQPR